MKNLKNTIKKNKFDIGFSVRYNKIFKVNHIKKFKFGIINLHGGNLPYYRGSNNHIFAIINKEKNLSDIAFCSQKNRYRKNFKNKKF